MNLLKFSTQDRCVHLLLSSPRLLKWIWFSSFKKMPSDTCSFCAGGIIILLSVMVPLELRVLSSGSFFLHSGCLAPCSLSAVLVGQGPAPHAILFLSLVFPLCLRVLLLWERPSFAYPVTAMAWPCWTAWRNSLSPGASCVLVPSHGLASVLCESVH